MTEDDSIFDDHVLLATIEAQTRAANKHGVPVRLFVVRTREFVAEVAKRYHRSAQMERVQDFVLDCEEPFFKDDAERDGYKIALGIEFQRRKMKSLNEQKTLDRSRPFAPR